MNKILLAISAAIGLSQGCNNTFIDLSGDGSPCVDTLEFTNTQGIDYRIEGISLGDEGEFSADGASGYYRDSNSWSEYNIKSGDLVVMTDSGAAGSTSRIAKYLGYDAVNGMVFFSDVATGSHLGSSVGSDGAFMLNLGGMFYGRVDPSTGNVSMDVDSDGPDSSPDGSVIDVFTDSGRKSIEELIDCR